MTIYVKDSLCDKTCLGPPLWKHVKTNMENVFRVLYENNGNVKDTMWKACLKQIIEIKFRIIYWKHMQHFQLFMSKICLWHYMEKTCLGQYVKNLWKTYLGCLVNMFKAPFGKMFVYYVETYLGHHVKKCLGHHVKNV